MNKCPVPTISLGELRADLAQYSDTMQISFSGLQYVCVKPSSDTTIQVQFEPHIYLDDLKRVVVSNPE